MNNGVLISVAQNTDLTAPNTVSCFVCNGDPASFPKNEIVAMKNAGIAYQGRTCYLCDIPEAESALIAPENEIVIARIPIIRTYDATPTLNPNRKATVVTGIDAAAKLVGYTIAGAAAICEHYGEAPLRFEDYNAFILQRHAEFETSYNRKYVSPFEDECLYYYLGRISELEKVDVPTGEWMIID